jgi:hypothetical protein
VKTKSIAAFLLVFIFLCALAGCHLNPWRKKPLEEPDGTTATGTIRVHIPTVSSHLLEAFGHGKAASTETGSYRSKALLIVSRVELVLHHPDKGDFIFMVTPSEAQGPDETVNGIEVVYPVEAGNGYTLTANVFNINVDSSYPVVSGTSPVFNVYPDTATTVHIRCKPNQPFALFEDMLGLPIEFMVKPSYQNEAGNSSIWGGEYWFSLNTAFSFLHPFSIEVQPGNDNLGDPVAAYFAVYDSTGAFITHDVSGASIYGDMEMVPGERAFTAVSRIDEGIYYIGVIAVSPNEDAYACSMSLIFNQFYDDMYEENDNEFEARSLDEDTVLSGVCLDQDFYSFDLTQKAKVVMECTFDYYDDNLDVLMLMVREPMWTREIIASSQNTFSGTELIEVEIDPVSYGTTRFYIDVLSNRQNDFELPPAGAAYQLRWHKYVDDLYEENDFIWSAYSLPENTWLSDLNGSGVSMDDDWYIFDVPEGSYTNVEVQIDCTFTHNEGNIDLQLCDLSEWIIEQSVSADDDEQIKAVLNPGLYYIRVFTNGTSTATPYDLWWARPGFIDVIVD